VASRGSGW